MHKDEFKKHVDGVRARFEAEMFPRPPPKLEKVLTSANVTFGELLTSKKDPRNLRKCVHVGNSKNVKKESRLSVISFYIKDVMLCYDLDDLYHRVVAARGKSVVNPAFKEGRPVQRYFSQEQVDLIRFQYDFRKREKKWQQPTKEDNDLIFAFILPVMQQVLMKIPGAMSVVSVYNKTPKFLRAILESPARLFLWIMRHPVLSVLSVLLGKIIRLSICYLCKGGWVGLSWGLVSDAVVKAIDKVRESVTSGIARAILDFYRVLVVCAGVGTQQGATVQCMKEAYKVLCDHLDMSPAKLVWAVGKYILKMADTVCPVECSRWIKPIRRVLVGLSDFDKYMLQLMVKVRSNIGAGEDVSEGHMRKVLYLLTGMIILSFIPMDWVTFPLKYLLRLTGGDDVYEAIVREVRGTKRNASAADFVFYLCSVYERTLVVMDVLMVFWEMILPCIVGSFFPSLSAWFPLCPDLPISQPFMLMPPPDTPLTPPDIPLTPPDNPAPQPDSLTTFEEIWASAPERFETVALEKEISCKYLKDQCRAIFKTYQGQLPPDPVEDMIQKIRSY